MERFSPVHARTPVARMDLSPFRTRPPLPTDRSLSACQKLEFLQEVREHLLLTPEEYMLLVVQSLRRHRNERIGYTHEPMRQAA